MLRTKMFAVTSVLALSAFALSACSMGDSGAGETDTPMSGDTGMSTDAPESAMPETDMPEETMDPAANLVGPACADYADAVPTGAGSISGMAQDPVAVAASNNPMLTTLVSAVSGKLNPDVDLVDTLNGSEFTVFAPVDDAFAMIDPATIESLKTDKDTLSSILTYHVVPGQIEPDAIEGMHTTVQGADLEVTGSGDNIMVNGAKVLCGGVQTANATVYLIDTVLMPPAE